MQKIKSFCVNHDVLEKGIYISRIDGDIVTYDLRMVIPNKGPYLENDGIHTFEHLFATYVRNSKYEDSIVYVGPMGCRTGFYFLTRDTINHSEVIALIQNVCSFIQEFNGKIPGTESSKECGNWLDHNLEKAKQYATDYGNVLKGWQVSNLYYEK